MKNIVKTLTLAAAALLAGCQSETGLRALDPCFEECGIEWFDSVWHPTPGDRAGSSVDFVQTFSHDQSELRWAAYGAPSAGAASSTGDVVAAKPGSGRVFLTELNRIDSQFEANTEVLQEYGATRFGAAVKATDLRKGSSIGLKSVDSKWLDGKAAWARSTSRGEELIVGAPGDYVGWNPGGGRAYWYYRETKAGESSSTPGEQWVRGATLRAPVALAGDRFGASVAVSHTLDTRNGGHPDFVAIGAPGNERVHVYAVNSAPFTSNASVLVHVQELTGLGGTGFGHALAIGDFDGDGHDDVAVGAPDEGPAGRVHVFLGTGTSLPLDPSVAETFDGAAAARGIAFDSFGFALAAGRVSAGSGERAGLVIGAPDSDVEGRNDVGAACIAHVAPRSLSCGTSRISSAGERYGRAVATGDFSAAFTDSSSAGCTEHLDDVAIAAFERRVAGRNRAGAVEILSHVNGEPNFDLRRVHTFEGLGTNYRFGWALASDYVQDSPHADLLIGAPSRSWSRGLVAVTRATCGQTLDGEWAGGDGGSTQMSLAISEDGDEIEVAMTQPATLCLARPNGDLCSFDDLAVWPFVAPSTSIDGTSALCFNGVLDFPTVPYNGVSATMTLDIADLLPGAVVGFFPNTLVRATLTDLSATDEVMIEFDEGFGLMNNALLNPCGNVHGNPIVLSRTSAVSSNGE